MCNKKKDVLARKPVPKPRTPMTDNISGGSLAPSFPEWSSELASNGRHEPTMLSSSSSGHLSTASLREALPEAPIIYNFSETFSATRDPLSRRLSSNSWRCNIRGKDAVIVQRRFIGDPADFRRRVSSSSGAHHKNIVRLLGAALGNEDLLLVYEFVDGARLSECLRNPKNPMYTPIATWIDRIQIAADIAQGLQYIHHFTTAGGLVHDRIKSSSIVITEIERRAKICHFAALEITRGTPEFDSETENGKIRRSGSGKLKLEGARGYISPEVRNGESTSQKSDVYAFGVVLLEILTGEEPLKYTYNAEIQGYEIVSLTESARKLMELLNSDTDQIEDQPTPEKSLRIRSWVDRRLKYSFPENLAERCVRVAVDCVQPQPEKRPTMVRVAGKLSSLLTQSKKWGMRLSLPEGVTNSLTGR